MIYTHFIPSKPVKEAKSPLDFEKKGQQREPCQTLGPEKRSVSRLSQNALDRIDEVCYPKSL